ncbi:MAG: CBS domain-containing protein [bacterium]|nr:CBS domain-containing protein [bacterium]
MLVQDHIRRHIITISQNATFREALTIMINNKTNGLIVVDNKNKPVGYIDSFSLVQESIPAYLKDNVTLAQFEPAGVFKKAIEKVDHHKVRDMMEDLHGVQIKEDDPIILAAALASKNNLRYIPVVDDDGYLVGLVSRTDVKRAMAELLGIKDDAQA